MIGPAERQILATMLRRVRQARLDRATHRDLEDEAVRLNIEGPHRMLRKRELVEAILRALPA